MHAIGGHSSVSLRLIFVSTYHGDLHEFSYQQITGIKLIIPHEPRDMWRNYLTQIYESQINFFFWTRITLISRIKLHSAGKLFHLWNHVDCLSPAYHGDLAYFLINRLQGLNWLSRVNLAICGEITSRKSMNLTDKIPRDTRDTWRNYLTQRRKEAQSLLILSFICAILLIVCFHGSRGSARI